MHIDQELTQRFMHGELAPADDLPVRQHLATCEQCRTRLESSIEEENEVQEWLRQLDHTPPALEAADIMAPPAPQQRGPRPGRRWLRAAAVVLLLGAAGAAYAYPGWPVRGWVDTAVERVVSAVTEFSTVATDAVQSGVSDATAPETEAQTGGLGVRPGSSLIVVFEAVQPARTASILLHDGDEVEATASRGAATFTAAGGRLVIGNAGSTAYYEIRVPRNAPRVEIRVGDRSVFLKNGATVTTDAVQRDDGIWVIDLGPEGESSSRP